MAAILVVDDEPDLRFLAQVALESEGHQVLTAANGADALAAVEVEVPDVVLLDVVMPEVNGWEVLDRFKAHLDERISTVRVIMMTSRGTDDDVARGGVSGAVRYLIKPVPAEELISTVAEVLSGDPEPEQRRAAQTDALTAIARMEKGLPTDADDPAPRPRLSGLERLRARPGETDDAPMVVGDELTDKQREVLRVVAGSDSVSNGAASLGVSRANVYASLRRSARTLGIDSVGELLESLRNGTLQVAPDEASEV